jgi:hypothetical protein
VGIAYESSLADNDLGRQPAQSEKSDLLAVLTGDSVCRVGQPDEGQSLSCPEGLKGPGIVRPYHHNRGINCLESVIIPTQLRHVPAAEWSHKTTVEHKQNIFPVRIFRKVKKLPLEVS